MILAAQIRVVRLYQVREFEGTVRTGSSIGKGAKVVTSSMTYNWLGDGTGVGEDKPERPIGQDRHLSDFQAPLSGGN